MTAFREYVSDNNLDLPDGYDDESRLVLRFLQGQRYNCQKCYETITLNVAWRKQQDLDYEHFRQDFAHGVLYGAGRDRSFRPIVIVNIRKMIDS